MDAANRLKDELLKQDFSEEQRYAAELEKYKQVARGYVRMENNLAVLSDMHTDASYVFYGGFAERLGIGRAGTDEKVDSIWEEEVFKRIHPEDLRNKYLQELRFLHFVKRLVKSMRRDYYFVSKLRMKDASGHYLPIMHRMFYIPLSSSSSIRLALCLYNTLSYDVPKSGIAVNSVTGEIRALEKRDDTKILSDREKQVLRLIDNGSTSKHIAHTLSISIHTVSRHRQEILKKFQVRNSIEACRVAKELGIFQ